MAKGGACYEQMANRTHELSSSKCVCQLVWYYFDSVAVVYGSTVFFSAKFYIERRKTEVQIQPTFVKELDSLFAVHVTGRFAWDLCSWVTHVN